MSYIELSSRSSAVPILSSCCQILPVCAYDITVPLSCEFKDPATNLSLFLVLTYKPVPAEANFPSLKIHLGNFKLRKLVSHKAVVAQYYHYFLKVQKSLGIPKTMAICYGWRVLEGIRQFRDQIFKEHGTSWSAEHIFINNKVGS